MALNLFANLLASWLARQGQPAREGRAQLPPTAAREVVRTTSATPRSAGVFIPEEVAPATRAFLESQAPSWQRRIEYGQVRERLPWTPGLAIREPLLGVRAIVRREGLEDYLRYDPFTGTVYLGPYRVPYFINIGGRTYARYEDIYPAIERLKKNLKVFVR